MFRIRSFTSFLLQKGNILIFPFGQTRWCLLKQTLTGVSLMCLLHNQFWPVWPIKFSLHFVPGCNKLDFFLFYFEIHVYFNLQIFPNLDYFCLVSIQLVYVSCIKGIWCLLSALYPISLLFRVFQSYFRLLINCDYLVLGVELENIFRPNVGCFGF